jgi:hypothetical protein
VQHELACFLQLLQDEENCSPDLQAHLNYRYMVGYTSAEYLKKIIVSFLVEICKKCDISFTVMMFRITVEIC